MLKPRREKPTALVRLMRAARQCRNRRAEGFGVSIEADDNLLENIKTEVSGDT